ncbi:MAG: hypothetical protein R3324_19155, partial [Halobacteriales archaeon]|nr:hypothetical protein [Halobacteriales archaeon]
MTSDQRGEPRPSGTESDIGSVEVQQGPAAALELLPQWAGLDTWILARSQATNGAACGWRPDESVELVWDDSIVLSLFTADQDGCFSEPVFLEGNELVVGEAFGRHKIVATGAVSGVEAQAPFDLVPRQLHVKPLSGGPGTSVALTGCGWDPTSVVNVFWLDSGDLIGKLNADAAGCVDGTGTIPRVADGFYALGATPDPAPPTTASGTSATLFEVRHADFTMSPAQGPRGTTVDLAGCGWSPDEQVAFSWDGTEDLGSFPVDADGCLTSVVDGRPLFEVPLDPVVASTGAHVVRATAGISPQAVEKTFTVTETDVSLDPMEGP